MIINRVGSVRGLRDRLLATRLLSAFEMTDARVTEYLDIIERAGCRQLFGYPSAVYLLCLQAQKQGRNLRDLGIKVVFVTGEVLFPHQRTLISETLNCPVADGYGGRDSGFISHECPSGGMHLMADAVTTAIVDAAGRPVPAGPTGQIVVTDLFSEDAPFLRYATGDFAYPPHGSEPAAGGPSGTNRRPVERSAVAPDGRLITALALAHPLRDIRDQAMDRPETDLFCPDDVQQRVSKDGEDRIR